MHHVRTCASVLDVRVAFIARPAVARIAAMPLSAAVAEVALAEAGARRRPQAVV